jgi:hypothetical protein
VIVDQAGNIVFDDDLPTKPDTVAIVRKRKAHARHKADRQTQGTSMAAKPGDHPQKNFGDLAAQRRHRQLEERAMKLRSPAPSK